MNGGFGIGVTRMPVRYSRALLIRGLAVWILARLAAVALYAFIAASAGRSLEVAAVFTNGSPGILAAWTVVLSAALVRLDLYRRHEVSLLNNLGVLTSHAMVLGALPAVVMEAAMAVLQ